MLTGKSKLSRWFQKYAISGMSLFLSIIWVAFIMQRIVRRLQEIPWLTAFYCRYLFTSPLLSRICVGVCQQWTGGDDRGRFQLWWAGSHLRNSKGRYRQSQNRRQTLGDRQRLVQADTYGLDDTQKENVPGLPIQSFYSWWVFHWPWKQANMPKVDW